MNNLETEIKIAWKSSVAEACAFLESRGYRLDKPRQLESDTLFDRAINGVNELLPQRKALRLRRISVEGALERALVTYKGPPQEGPHKVREEIEFEAADADAAELLLNRLGYAPWFRYEKRRSTFRAASEPGIATVDETPIGVFLELEGPADWIDRTASSLGYSQSDYVTGSYSGLYRAFRASHPRAPRDMLFTN